MILHNRYKNKMYNNTRHDNNLNYTYEYHKKILGCTIFRYTVDIFSKR